MYLYLQFILSYNQKSKRTTHTQKKRNGFLNHLEEGEIHLTAWSNGQEAERTNQSSWRQTDVRRRVGGFPLILIKRVLLIGYWQNTVTLLCERKLPPPIKA